MNSAKALSDLAPDQPAWVICRRPGASLPPPASRPRRKPFDLSEEENAALAVALRMAAWDE